jgi:hypothetical protein
MKRASEMEFNLSVYDRQMFLIPSSICFRASEREKYNFFFFELITHTSCVRFDKVGMLNVNIVKFPFLKFVRLDLLRHSATLSPCTYTCVCIKS